MTSYIIAIAVKTVNDHFTEWFTIATFTPVVYLLLKKRKQGLIQKWLSQLLLKKRSKEIDKSKFGGRLSLSLLLALGLGLAFGFLITWQLGLVIGLGGLLLGFLVVFKPQHHHEPPVF